MQEEPTKKRTPSRCREWERNRRNKFNDALTRLGEMVKEINRALYSSNKDPENAQYPKIEIVEKAIQCLKNYLQDKIQLKAEILALQVRVDSYISKKKQDASTQVFLRIKKKTSDKQVNIVTIDKSKCHNSEEKQIPATSTTKPTVSKHAPKDVAPKIFRNLPTLLPKSTLTEKKGPENTIVVLPAAPYIFPQRPLLFPTVPPAFVLVDSSLQTLNKSPFPIVNRTSDVTKTTMVNILPLTAYSRPLSVTKSKKNIKQKLDIPKKPVKNSKQNLRGTTNSSISNNTKTVVSQTVIENKNKEIAVSVQNSENVESPKLKETSVEVSSTKENLCSKSVSNESIMCNKDIPVEKIQLTENHVSSVTPEIKNTEAPSIVKDNIEVVEILKNNENAEHSTTSNKLNKIPAAKPTLPEDKDKENKLPNILDPSLCENHVDVGNARLELAEEFLATSPTAAFLMSFPLVSGNRADSPAEETPSAIQIPSKDHDQRRSDMLNVQSGSYFEKSNDNKSKSPAKSQPPSIVSVSKESTSNKYLDNLSNKNVDINKTPSTITPTTSLPNDNPFLNLPMSSLISTNAITEPSYSLDFDCNITKSTPSQSNYVSSNNIFYKSDPFSSVKNTIYSTSSISSTHDFNSFGLYPCAMEKYAPKNKADYSNVEDNIVKLGSSRLTYDIDLGWSHKGFDFVNCTSGAGTFNKDNMLTTSSASSYNPFNPEFHVPLTPNTTKKDVMSKPITTFSEPFTSLYSQSANLWTEDVPFYSNNNISKSLGNKPQNYLPLDNIQQNAKGHTSKLVTESHAPMKAASVTQGPQQLTEKFTKKSPSKMHINWMTSEIRPMQNNCNTSNEIKDTIKTSYNQFEHNSKKQDHNESSNYFPLSMHNFSSQVTPEDIQTWPSTRTLGTTEISIEPPPINLPTLVGDLALGPHDKKKNTEVPNRNVSQSDIQNCSNFFSVTHLMNRSTDNTMSSRYQGLNSENKAMKQNISHSSNDIHRKVMPRLDNNISQSYLFNELKPTNSYETMTHFPVAKSKPIKPEKSSKNQKNSYSAESLIRGGTCTQKVQEQNIKFVPSAQKYNDINVSQDGSIAQVSHFPPILDYTDNSYTGQQFSGTNLYNTTTNTMSNSFYSNFVPGSSNLMSSNYATGPFSGDFIDYSQSAECNYPNHKYEELKMRNNSTMFQPEKVPSNYKRSRRDSGVKHKLECSKKDTSKKYQNKRAKLNAEVEEWHDTSNLLWQNKAPTAKRHTNLISEELPFSNYVGNQMPTQYQPDFFNSHLMPSNMQTVSHNVDRSLTSFPVTSRANFNLSTIFPEITMKVQ